MERTKEKEVSFLSRASSSEGNESCRTDLVSFALELDILGLFDESWETVRSEEPTHDQRRRFSEGERKGREGGERGRAHSSFLF